MLCGLPNLSASLMLFSSDDINMYSTDGSDVYKVLMGFCLLHLIVMVYV
jgi:hypothetical protein